MAKIADLIVNLTLESAAFRKEVESSRRDVQKLSSDITSSFRTMANVVGISLGAISAAAAVDFVKSIAQSADEINKLSQKIGISVEDLSTLQHVLKLSDVPTEEFSRGVGLLSKALAGLADDQENKGAGAALQALGIKARDASGDLRPVADVVLDIAAKFKGFQDGVGKTNLALQLFGRSGKELIPFLNQGADGIQRLQEEARAMGLEISGATAASAERFHDSLERLEDKSVGLSRQFLDGLVPALDVISERFDTAATSGNNFFKTLGSNVGLYGTGAALGLASALLQLRRAQTSDLQTKALIDAEQRELDAAFNKLRKGYGLPTNEPLDTSLIPSHGATAITQKVQPPNIPDQSAIAAAAKYAAELQKARQELEKIASKATSDDFGKAVRELGDDIDKILANLAKFPQLTTTGPQRIGGLVEGALRDYLDKIDKIGDEAKKEVDGIIADIARLEEHKVVDIPIPVPKTLPTLVGDDFYTNFIRSLSANKKSLQKELDDLLGVRQFKASIDEIILETRNATAGIGVFFRQYADYATNSAKVVHDAFAKVFSALEDQLTNLLAHFKFDIKSLLDTIKESIARAVVQKFILGPIAKALGLTKRDGSTKDNALYVEVTNGGGLFGGVGGSGGSSDSGDSGDGGDSSSGILGKIQGVMGKVFSAIGSFFKAIGSALVSAFKFIGGAIGGLFGGGKATGGDVFAGKFYLTGENGPELFAPGRSGTIIPNHVAFGGASHTSNVTQNFYLSPVRSDPFGYSQSQLAAATFTGYARATSRA
jgi:hypothetical protein